MPPISIRAARQGDEMQIATVHDASWTEAYRGVIPGGELARMVARRGGSWWAEAIRRRTPILVATCEDLIVGYCSYGRNRVPKALASYQGELFEIYVLPRCQSAGVGKMLFDAAHAELRAHQYFSSVVWSLEENLRATRFLESLGGRLVLRATETLGGKDLPRLAFGFGEIPRGGGRPARKARRET